MIARYPHTLSRFYAYLDYVREHGVDQFLHIWENVKSRTNDELLWGDELEYHIFQRNAQTGVLTIANVAEKVLHMLEEEDKKEKDVDCTWHPEFGAWMVEATPSRPYAGFASDLRAVETNMRVRRFRVNHVLDQMSNAETRYQMVSMVAWPRLGLDLAVDRSRNVYSDSEFLPDEAINPHPRFATLVNNIRMRRGEKVKIMAPLFVDSQTPPKSVQEGIYMDAMGFGMGMCCLQVTFQGRDLNESRYLYDQLAILCPLFLSLTAGCPVLKGQLADTDCRWNIIAQSVDCRTEEERGKKNGKGGKRSHGVIRKSRYDSVDLFMSSDKRLLDKYNDVHSEVDQPTLDKLMQAGVDDRLARHVAHLFVRDPLVMFEERIRQVDDTKSTEHFENIQSTNWQTMRWKPPPNAASMGWRVEFRPMEVQFTDFENAAFTVVVMLCARVILFFDLNLYLPLSKVDENMQRAQQRDAVLKERFFFRKRLVVLESQCKTSTETSEDDDSFEEMTLAEIMLGTKNEFPGLVPLIWSYLDVIGVDAETRSVVEDYIDLVVKRSTGELPTPAKWMRSFLERHPSYQHDSLVTAEMTKDLVQEVVLISHGEKACPALLGKHLIAKLGESIDRAELKLRTPPLGKALRGSSFHTQLGTTPESTFQCAIVRSLVEKYRKNAESGSGEETLYARNKESLVTEARTFQQAKPLLSSSTTL